jgi:hypothetical protein
MERLSINYGSLIGARSPVEGAEPVDPKLDGGENGLLYVLAARCDLQY